jgi:hypothetical protein
VKEIKRKRSFLGENSNIRSEDMSELAIFILKIISEIKGKTR